MISYVLGFMFSEDRQRVLMIKKNKPALLAGLWNGVGGKVELCETYEKAMVREFEEEVGIKTNVDEWEHCLFFTGPDSNGGDFAISVYRSFSDKVGTYRKMESEEPCVWTMEYLFAAGCVPVVNNLKWMLPLLADRSVLFPLAVQQS